MQNDKETALVTPTHVTLRGAMRSPSRASALLLGCAMVAAIRTRAWSQVNATVRIAIPPIDAAAEAWYAQDLGYFSKAGLNVDIQVMQTTSQISAALAANALDIGFVTIDVISTMYQKKIPLTVIAPATEYVAGSERITGLLVTATSPIRTAKDLNGKIIAVSGLHSLTTTAPSAWMDQHGGDSSTVKFVELPFPAMAAAVEAGRVDAAQIAEPFFTAAQKTLRVLAYDMGSLGKHFIQSVWAAAPEWAQAHPDLVSAFSEVIYKTAQWANNNHAKSGEILARYTKIDPSVIATMARGIYGEHISADLIQPAIDVSAKYNNFTPFPAQMLLPNKSR